MRLPTRRGPLRGRGPRGGARGRGHGHGHRCGGGGERGGGREGDRSGERGGGREGDRRGERGGGREGDRRGGGGAAAGAGTGAWITLGQPKILKPLCAYRPGEAHSGVEAHAEAHAVADTDTDTDGVAEAGAEAGAEASAGAGRGAWITLGQPKGLEPLACAGSARSGPGWGRRRERTRGRRRAWLWQRTGRGSAMSGSTFQTSHTGRASWRATSSARPRTWLRAPRGHAVGHRKQE